MRACKNFPCYVKIVKFGVILKFKIILEGQENIFGGEQMPPGVPPLL